MIPEHYLSDTAPAFIFTGVQEQSMQEDIESRIITLFETRARSASDVSPETVEALFGSEGQRDFGDDEELLETVAESFRR